MRITEEIKSLSEINLAEIKLPILVIYNRPKDFPDSIVLRVWDMDKSTPYIIVANTLEEIHALIPHSFAKMYPDPNDDPVILETWV